MRNFFSMLLFVEVFEQNAIPAIPFLLILLVGSPFFIAMAVIKWRLNPPRNKFPEELADEELLKAVRRGKIDPGADGVKAAEQRIYTGYYDLLAIDNPPPKPYTKRVKQRRPSYGQHALKHPQPHRRS